MANPINKVKINYDNFTKLMEDLGARHDIRVGIIGDKAYEIHKGTQLTNAHLGAIHEFGATINHPGGQPYYIDEKTGQCRFVKKDSELGQKLIAKGQVTKAHQIVIPTRSFLRMPLLSAEGKKYVKDKTIKALKQEYGKDFESFLKGTDKISQRVLGKDIANKIASVAWSRVLDAFETGGFGKWAKVTAATMRNRQNQDNDPLLDTGELRDSISADVDGEPVNMTSGNGLRGGTITPIG